MLKRSYVWLLAVGVLLGALGLCVHIWAWSNWGQMAESYGAKLKGHQITIRSGDIQEFTDAYTRMGTARMVATGTYALAGILVAAGLISYSKHKDVRPSNVA